MKLSFEDSPLAVLGGLRPPRPPPMLKGTHGGGNAACRAKDKSPCIYSDIIVGL